MTAVSCENLPIIDITRENCADKWDLLSAAIQSSTFIALDIVKFKLQGYILFILWLKNDSFLKGNEWAGR